MRSIAGARSISALLFLVAANLIWAGQGVAVKLLDGQLGPLAIALLPFYCSTLLGLFFLLLKPNFSSKLASAWKSRGKFFLVGIGGQFLAQVGMTVGVTWSLAANGAILSMLIPILSALMATWLLKERLTALRIGNLLLGIAGVVLLVPTHTAAGAGAPARALMGNLFITAGCLGSAFYNVYSKRLQRQFSDLEILFFSYLTTTLLSVPILAFVEPNCLLRFAHCDSMRWFAFGYLSIFMYGISMVLFLRALRQVDAIIASASLYLVPLFGVSLAFVILHERLAPRAIVGSATVILATLILFRFDSTAEQGSIQDGPSSSHPTHPVG
jgi:drug/metabolite transporter (DMT)-like permease